jgi:hypothetical protein
MKQSADKERKIKFILIWVLPPRRNVLQSDMREPIIDPIKYRANTVPDEAGCNTKNHIEKIRDESDE